MVPRSPNPSDHALAANKQEVSLFDSYCSTLPDRDAWCILGGRWAMQSCWPANVMMVVEQKNYYKTVRHSKPSGITRLEVQKYTPFIAIRNFQKSGCLGKKKLLGSAFLHPAFVLQKTNQPYNERSSMWHAWWSRAERLISQNWIKISNPLAAHHGICWRREWE